eukprot:CAMPEP_0185258634 /NCGR_PEP_ID=MMETSP1359-20130426/7531_1 /TAXON_ID=552665 /ORGANISM="Bigelowiella longifila, Strain CCMP242" /LENGTH=314 /DNA_ID=CAMNT_0027844207 /DNA_START=165 /DNA_END=1109 /DNA_ORIENTATION=+
MRLSGGMYSLVEALSSQIPKGCIHLESEVIGISYKSGGVGEAGETEGGEDDDDSTREKDSGDPLPHVVVRIRRTESKEKGGDDGLEAEGKEHGVSGEGGTTKVLTKEIDASHVIVAVPPRLLVKDILTFNPKLPKETMDGFRRIPTWMAPHGKMVAVYQNAFWRKKGLSGSGGSRAGPLSEIHDASPMEGRPALFGFLALNPQQRASKGTNEIISNAKQQLSRMFGEEAQNPESLFYVDWAQEKHTAGDEDVKFGFTGGHPDYEGIPRDAAGLWDGHLDFAGTELSEHHGGFLEGALCAAEAAVHRFLGKATSN